MKKAMKKITYLLIAAMSLVSVASCVKELTPEPFVTGDGIAREFTVTLPPATRTDLVEGKTVWAKGDSLWVSNGVSSESVVVPEEYWGQKEFKFVVKNATFSDTTKTIYVVYPYLAAGGLTEGKVKVKIPGVQDGLFANANIAAAVAEDYNVNLKNVTAVLKVTVPEDTKAPIYSLAIGAANGNPLTGTCTVDFSGDVPALIPPTTPGSNISVQVDALTGDFFVATIPGTYDAGFTLMAATTDFANAFETKQTTVANMVKVNDLIDLGTIGSDLQPLSGDGTEANPYILESLGHVIAFTGAVDDGKDFAGEFVKLGADIEGVTMPIGSLSITNVTTASGKPFRGHFDGSGHTVTLNITASTAGRSKEVGLFGGLGNGAVVENLVIDGKVSMGGCNFIGALAGSIQSGDQGITIKNVTNKAEVRGNNTIGGLVGYSCGKPGNLLVIEDCTNEGNIIAGSYGVGGIVGRSQLNDGSNSTYKQINKCKNSGSIEGQYNIGGIVGHGYYTALSECENSGAIKSTNCAATLSSIVNKAFSIPSSAGAGGIAGYLQNSSISKSENAGPITGPNKLGGIVGAPYWANMTECINRGTVTSAGNCIGGISGWSPAQGNHTRCVNYGAVSGNNYVGGIQGYADMGSSSGSAGQKFYSCVNEGEVSATTEASGGIIGCTRPYSSSNPVQVNECVNRGKVSVKYRGAGIVASVDVYSNSSYTVLRNCQNDGVVYSYRTDADNGCVLGGIAGWCVKTPTGDNAGLRIYNCLNTGKVQYAKDNFKNVYCGGIVGWMKTGTINNAVNLGTISSTGGVQAEGVEARMGSIVGQLDNVTTNPQRSFISEVYAPTGLAASFAGTTGISVAIFAANCANARTFSEWGELSDLVTIKGTDSFIVDEALNLWVSGNTDYAYYTWTWADKPEFAKE